MLEDEVVKELLRREVTFVPFTLSGKAEIGEQL